MVNYLVEVRGGDLAKVGYVPSGQAAGTLLGRLLLMEPTHRFGEKPMLLLYFVISIGLQLVFWLVPNIIAGATALSIMGFFQGPFFATVSVEAGICEDEYYCTGKSLMMLWRREFQSHRNFSRGKSNRQLSVRKLPNSTPTPCPYTLNISLAHRHTVTRFHICSCSGGRCYLPFVDRTDCRQGWGAGTAANCAGSTRGGNYILGVCSQGPRAQRLKSLYE